jgi:primosomal protein N' (replication factor Y)
MHCTVLVSSKSPGIGDGLTYDSGDLPVRPGSFIRVPLRKAFVEGVVPAVEEKKKSEAFDVKKITELLSGQPLLTEAQLRTIRWISAHYCCTQRHAIGPFLPAPPWSALLPKSRTYYKLASGESLHHIRGKKREAVIEFLRGRDVVTREELQSMTGASSKTIRDLIELKALEESSHADNEEDAPASYELAEALPPLSDAQNASYERIKASEKPSLLFGITGSGKTEVYAKLIADEAARGRQSILLVPEILLTEQSIQRFERMFDPSRIAVIHSRLTGSARREQWRKIRSGQAALVVGSRSALFSPCPRLGLVVIDEEHEWTYKNEQTPRYHARETAEALCRYAGAKLVLGSATPSLESWERAKTGRYTLARIDERYQQRPLPPVRIIDLGTVAFGNMYPFSPPLLEAIGKRLQKREQCVLFLNRRGIATGILCLGCRKRLISPETQLPYTLHRTPAGVAFLMDHISGQTANFPATCPYCASPSLLAVGAGTQKLEDLLTTFFPDARLLRADSDTLKFPEQMRLLLKKMTEGEADILLGTQSVVKGLDLPGVTLAAVLVADVGLSLPHFRAGERVFQLLTQLTGRSGRTVPGEVIIQTFRPDAVEVTLAAKHATEEYLEQELKLRLMAKYPPATQMIRLLIQGPDAASRARMLHSGIQRAIKNLGMDLIANCSPTLFGAGKVWHILLRGAEPRTILPGLDLSGVTVDVDPVDCV